MNVPSILNVFLSATLLGLIACAGPRSLGEELLRAYLPDVQLNSRVKAIRDQFPTVAFIPFMGLRAELDAAVDSMRVVEFLISSADHSAPSDRAAIESIRLLGFGSASGRLALRRAQQLLGPPTREGCSGIAAIGQDATYYWESPTYTILLTVPTSRQVGFQSVSKLSFQRHGRRLDELVDGFRTTACDMDAGQSGN